MFFSQHQMADWESPDLDTPIVPDKLTLDWLLCRDTLFGHNCVKQDVAAAVSAAKLLADQGHPEASWLVNEALVGMGDKINSQTVSKTLLMYQDRIGHSNARALVYSKLLQTDYSLNREEMMELTKRDGTTLAEVWCAARVEGGLGFLWASNAAKAGERDGFFWLGWAYANGDGVEKNLELAKKSYLRASELQSVEAYEELGKILCAENDPGAGCCCWFCCL